MCVCACFRGYLVRWLNRSNVCFICNAFTSTIHVMFDRFHNFFFVFQTSIRCEVIQIKLDAIFGPIHFHSNWFFTLFIMHLYQFIFLRIVRIGRTIYVVPIVLIGIPFGEMEKLNFATTTTNYCINCNSICNHTHTLDICACARSFAYVIRFVHAE